MAQPFHRQDVIDRARRLSAVHPRPVVAELTGIPRRSLIRIAGRGWTSRVGRGSRPMPSDFAIQSRHIGQDELCRHYRTSSKLITRCP
jgi:hypothetical protein